MAAEVLGESAALGFGHKIPVIDQVAALLPARIPVLVSAVLEQPLALALFGLPSLLI